MTQTALNLVTSISTATGLRKETPAAFLCSYIQASYFSSVDNPSQAFLHVLFYGPDGPVIKEERLPIAKDPSSVTIMAMIGWDEPGPWQPGIYRVELIVGDKLIAADEFQISDP